MSESKDSKRIHLGGEMADHLSAIEELEKEVAFRNKELQSSTAANFSGKLDQYSDQLQTLNREALHKKREMQANAPEGLLKRLAKLLDELAALIGIVDKISPDSPEYSGRPESDTDHQARVLARVSRSPYKADPPVSAQVLPSSSPNSASNSFAVQVTGNEVTLTSTSGGNKLESKDSIAPTVNDDFEIARKLQAEYDRETQKDKEQIAADEVLARSLAEGREIVQPNPVPNNAPATSSPSVQAQAPANQMQEDEALARKLHQEDVLETVIAQSRSPRSEEKTNPNVATPSNVPTTTSPSVTPAPQPAPQSVANPSVPTLADRYQYGEQNRAVKEKLHELDKQLGLVLDEIATFNLIKDDPDFMTPAEKPKYLMAFRNKVFIAIEESKLLSEVLDRTDPGQATKAVYAENLHNRYVELAANLNEDISVALQKSNPGAAQSRGNANPVVGSAPAGANGKRDVFDEMPSLVGDDKPGFGPRPG